MTIPLQQPVAFAKWEAPNLRVKMSPATNVSGWTFILNVRDSDGDVVLQSSSYTVTDTANGWIVFAVTSAQAAAIGVGDFDYDIWRTDSGSEKRLAWGTLSVVSQQWK